MFYTLVLFIHTKLNCKKINGIWGHQTKKKNDSDYDKYI